MPSRSPRSSATPGAVGIDVSTGQVTPTSSLPRPLLPDPFADAIRNRLGLATIAVGVISSYDEVNSVLLSGRADLCAMGRANLYNPSWTPHAAAEQDYDGDGALGPLPWRAGRRKPQGGRTDGRRPRLELIRDGTPQTRHARWRLPQD